MLVSCQSNGFFSKTLLRAVLRWCVVQKIHTHCYLEHTLDMLQYEPNLLLDSSIGYIVSIDYAPSSSNRINSN